jgi:hypothetical protein
MREVLTITIRAPRLVLSFPYENTNQTRILFMDRQSYLKLVNGLSETKQSKCKTMREVLTISIRAHSLVLSFPYENYS